MQGQIKDGATETELLEIASRLKGFQGQVASTFAKKDKEDHGLGDALGVLNSPFDAQLRRAVKETVEDIKAQGTDVRYVVLAGIGGSELGATSLISTIRSRGVSYYPITSLSSDYINAILGEIHPKQTILIMVSRSGTTKETLTAYSVVRNFLKAKLGDSWKQHCVAILGTDKQDLAKQEAEHTKVQIIGSMSGRYTGMHAANLFTMALMGVDIDKFHEGAREMLEECQTMDLQKNQALLLAALKYRMLKTGRNVMTTNVFSPYLVKYGDWLDQLTEESLGQMDDIKHCTKTTELSNKLHSDFQNWLCGADIFFHQFVFPLSPQTRVIENPLVQGETLADIELAAYLGTVKSLAERGRPSYTTFMDKVSEKSMGQLMMRDMLSVIYLCELFKLGEVSWTEGKGYFNQPGVQAYKKIMTDLLKNRQLLAKELEQIEGQRNL